MDEYHSFYDFLYKLNTAFIRYILVTLQVALDISIQCILKVYKEVPLSEILYNFQIVTKVGIDLALFLNQFYSKIKIIRIQNRHFLNPFFIKTVNISKNTDPNKIMLAQANIRYSLQSKVLNTLILYRRDLTRQLRIQLVYKLQAAKAGSSRRINQLSRAYSEGKIVQETVLIQQSITKEESQY